MKAITYRVMIIILDIVSIYLLTGRYEIAIGFMIVSNKYTSLAYYYHERLWSRISWGRKREKI